MVRRVVWGALVVLAVASVGLPSSAVPVEADQCIESRESVETNYADVTATVEQPANRSDTVRITYTGLRADDRLEVQLPSSATITRTDGFRPGEGTADVTYTGEERAVLEYRIGNEAAETQYANGSDWLFAPAPTHIGTGVQLELRPAGVAGNRFLYLGNYTEYTTTVGCHDISLVNAQAGDLPTRPERVMRALEYAATTLDVGHKYDQVTIFTTPGFAHPPNPGFARGSDAWVTKSWPTNRGSYTRMVLHEYIHTRQGFGRAAIGGMGWVTEASADYFSYTTAVEVDAVSTHNYNRWLRNGSQMDAILTNRSTWSSSYVQYNRGGAYMAILDQRIQTTSNRSLESVVRRLNAIGDESVPVIIQRSVFLDTIENTSSASVREWANASMDSSTEFDTSRATQDVADTSVASRLADRFEQRTANKPYAAVMTALLMGIVVGMLPYEYKREKSAEAEGSDAAADEDS